MAKGVELRAQMDTETVRAGRDMAKGVELRAQMDTETVRALLLINGGGAIALLTLLSSVLGKPDYVDLAHAILCGVLVFMLGLVFAVIHNRLRRKCSLLFEQHGMCPPKGRVLGIELSQPTVCWLSERFMWLSIAAFISAGVIVAVVGLVTINRPQITSKVVPGAILNYKPDCFAAPIICAT
jgi:hypothetical protein